MAEQKNNPQAEQDLGQQTKIRREKLAVLQNQGKDPFQITRFDWDTTSGQIKENFDAMEGRSVKVAGRLMSKRGMGKVSFCDLQDRDGRIQLYARQDEMDEAAYQEFKKYDIGDIVGVDGEVFRTQRGRDERPGQDDYPALQVAPAFAGEVPRPDQHRAALPPAVCGSHGEPRGQRNFVLRSQFIRHVREFLDSRGYMEVETPVLNTISGGATARPFITHHNTLDIDMYMRIATELP